MVGSIPTLTWHPSFNNPYEIEVATVVGAKAQGLVVVMKFDQLFSALGAAP